MSESSSRPSLRRTWWKEAVVYQIYPRSFNDSTGNGVGDLRGITERLDHLEALGIDVVWLSPVYDSPMADNGYDIRDYRAVSPLFGTMDDFDTMLAAMHDRGIRLVMDLVVNHTSDEHAWFAASRASRNNPKRDFYIWRPSGPDGGPPNNWRSFFGGPAWTLDERTGEYYLHLFDRKQPDLNWTNPNVRAAIYDMMRFWLDKGVDGFRMDVITMISKKEGLPDMPPDASPFRFYANGPELHAYLHEMNRRVLSHYDAMTVGEGWGILPTEALDYVGADRDELDTFFHFDHIQLTRDGDFYTPRDWSLPELKTVFRTWDDAFARDGWTSLFFGNHDMPRMVSCFGDDDPVHRRNASTLLHTFLLTMRGTPYVYQGDELGMANAPFETLDDFQDVSSLGDVREKVDAGADPETILENHRALSRDNARTPVPWEDGPHAGFTDDTPWLPVHTRTADGTAAEARQDPDSVYHFLRHLIALRHRNPVLVYGSYADLLPDDEQVWAYERRLDDTCVRVLLNWSSTPASVSLPSDGGAWTLWTGNVRPPRDVDASGEGDDAWTLDPWEAVVVGNAEPTES